MIEMEPQNIILGINSLSLVTGTGFIWMWIKGVNSKLKELQNDRITLREFDDYKKYVTDLRLIRDNERDEFKRQLDRHGHRVVCKVVECNATAEEVYLR